MLILGISMLLQVLFLILGLYRNAPLYPLIGGLVGIGTLADLLLGGNTITYYSAGTLVTVQVAGLSAIIFLILPIMSFLSVARGISEK